MIYFGKVLEEIREKKGSEQFTVYKSCLTIRQAEGHCHYEKGGKMIHIIIPKKICGLRKSEMKIFNALQMYPRAWAN